MFRTSNPALNNDAFKASQTWDDVYGPGQSPAAAEKNAVNAARPGHMTVAGVVQKSSFMIGLTVFGAAATWHAVLPEDLGGMGVLNPYFALIAGIVGGLVLFLPTIFIPKISPFVALPYALVEGLFVGAISAVYAVRFAPEPDAVTNAVSLNTGLIFNAVLLTMAIFAGMLGAYAFKIIRPGKVFYNVVISATCGLCLFTLVAIVMSLFGNSSLISVYDPSNGGLVSIGFSLFVVVLAAFNLVLDFDQVALGERNRAPKYMEWFSSMALLWTLVWLYVEVLRLLAKLQSRE